ncbi:hypothetical protein [Galbibacter pacificus]|uniref:LVIVD repeat-containing protein n=1 Tax=Galbibacter pacificus TaxID=2996052 RepID=A0ABT6FS09_9FLAO|nr:hypothetical protein [Galbibacter pacificus]MDG3582827.1 hypothetical protein [Galbibacter pacificus]MDG3586054.1 hypothetical protein [Galbibacter pacificus]
MKKAKNIGMLTFLVLLVACQSNDDNSDIQEPGESNVILTDNNLSERVKLEHIGVISIKGAPEKNPEESSEKSSNNVPGENLKANDFPLVQIAEVSAPVYKGTTLRATHVEINETYAYVSYNVEGDTYLGAIDVIDISNPLNPSVILQAIFPNTDISSIDYYQNALYIAGANPSIANDGTNPAFLIKMLLNDGLPTENLSLMDMPGYVATDVIANTNGIFGVSGDNGVLAKYNLGTQQLDNDVSLPDLRAVGNYNNKIVVLSGTEGIHIYNAGNLNKTNSFATSKDIAEAKRTIDFFDNNVLVAEGSKGIGIYNINNGSKITTIKISEVDPKENIDPNDLVTNAVSVEDKHIFAASGAGGVSVYTINDNISDLTTIGTLNLEGSANYVKSANDYIFVADGKGGLKILKAVAETDSSSGIVCTDYPVFKGGYWLNVNSNSDEAYSGSASLMGINVNSKAHLIFCGALAVNKGININSEGTFLIKGTLAQGTSEAPYNALIVNNKGILQIEGSLVIYGNMILNNGATLEFLGNDSSITVYGNVIKNGNITITGNYTDTFNSLE